MGYAVTAPTRGRCGAVGPDREGASGMEPDSTHRGSPIMKPGPALPGVSGTLRRPTTVGERCHDGRRVRLSVQIIRSAWRHHRGRGAPSRTTGQARDPFPARGSPPTSRRPASARLRAVPEPRRSLSSDGGQRAGPRSTFGRPRGESQRSGKSGRSAEAAVGPRA